METIFVTDLPVVEAVVTTLGANNHFLHDRVMRGEVTEATPTDDKTWRGKKKALRTFSAGSLGGSQPETIQLRVRDHPGVHSVRSSWSGWAHCRTTSTPLVHFRLNECQRSSSLHCICLNAILDLYQWSSTSIPVRTRVPGDALHKTTATSYCHVIPLFTRSC